MKIRDSSLYCKGYETRQSHWETGKTVRLLLIRQSEDLLAAMLPPLRAIRRRIASIAGNRPRQFDYWRGFFASLSAALPQLSMGAGRSSHSRPPPYLM